ncbi:MAG: class I SAM-dependent methyltransferase [Gaiellaceae bacterium]
MDCDPKRLVESGYDAMADRFSEWQRGITGSMQLERVEELLGLLPERPDVLELGAGAGGRSTRMLAERGRLTGVDISAEQVRRARERVPGATFLQADLAEVVFAPGSFDAVVALYVFNHVPHDDLRRLIPRIFAWLRPAGLFLASYGVSDAHESVEDDWLGVPMFFSSLGADGSRRLLGAAGFEIAADEVETIEEPDQGAARFLWLLGRKPE